MNVITILKILASDRRLKLIRILDRTNQTAIELYRKFNSEYGAIGHRETVYRDLEMLRDVGIVTKNYDRKAKKLYYNLSAEQIAINLKTLQVKLG